MLATELRIEELLKFQPEQGKVFLKDSRVVIFDATSVGTLRKDLIDTLGMDRAKGFLIRYGWTCGFETAMSIKGQFAWDNDHEWNNAGPYIHTQEGFALVKTNIINANRQKGTIFVDANWEYSIEAEHHLAHYGLHHESVCWMMVGWASGYASAAMGKTVIIKEVKCVGKGDTHCALIGKTIEQWGEEINSELPYYEASKINEELEAAHQKVKTQNKILGQTVTSLEQTVAIHERLTECILHGKGVEDIAASLMDLMKCTVIIEDSRLAPQFICSTEEPYPRDLLAQYIPIQTSPSFNKAAAFYLQQKRPFEITDQNSDITVYRLVSPILVSSELLGFVSLLRPEQPFSEMEQIALEHAASVFALKILEEKKIADVERRLKGDFIDDLLSAKFTDPDSIIKRARRLQYDITLPHRVLIFEVNNFTELIKSFKQNEPRILQFKTELANIVQSGLDELSKGMVVNKSDDVVMLIQLDCPDKAEKDTRQLAVKIMEKISDRFPNLKLSVGIGSICTDPAGFYQSYLSAQKSLDIAKVLKKKGEMVSLEQFGTHALLFSALNSSDLNNFALSQLGTLLEHDEKHRAQFIHTLQEFLNNRGNVERTAKSMNISKSGFKYRLQRIEEITGQDPKEAQSYFNFQLALNILQLVGIDKLK